MRAGSVLLRSGVATLAVSLVAALLLANPQDVFGDHRTLLMLTSWVERTLFWVGLIFIAGAVLDQVYGPRRD
jgi:cell shape-determining protein MreD